MGREARAKSETGIYHVMLRGIDKRDIFLAEEDYLAFIRYVKKAQEKIDFTIYAYCLMTNHVHMLMKTEELIGDIVKRIAVGYAQYHNVKNGRTGHLFQNRFKSEVVEDDRYFLTLLRYIHQNPIKAGITQNMQEYKWSSYCEYLTGNKLITDTDFGFTYFKSLNEFTEFMEENNDDECLDYNPSKRWKDDELKNFINDITDMDNLSKLDKESRNKILKSIKFRTGASNRQLSSVLGIGRSILEKIK